MNSDRIKRQMVRVKMLQDLIKSNNINVSLLAKRLNMIRENLYKILRLRDYASEDMLDKIEKEVRNMIINDETLGGKLKRARIRAGFSQNQVSKMTGLARSTIESYENNHRRPNLVTLAFFSFLYDVDLSYFVEENEKNSFLINWRRKWKSH